MALTSGTKLGPYEIVALIGAGGMGEVYRARDFELGRDVAIKVLPRAFSEDADRLRRFRQEAQATAALNHPNILAIFQIGQQDGSPYIVSELLEGESLRQRLQSGPLPLRKTIEYAVQVARGLAAAHDKGIVHRDLKPENIFINKDGRAKILDFGLAKLTRPEEGAENPNSPTMTRGSEPGVTLGTAGYMSPEQVRGQAAGPASDLFSFGAILYEMLTGNRAFRGATAADKMSAILKEDPAEFSLASHHLLPAVERIVRHCLEKNPEERFQSARDVAFDLEALSAASGAATTLPSVGAARKTKPLVIAAAGLTLVAAFGAGALFSGRKRHESVPVYHRVTFHQGPVQAARFTPDGQSIVYSASWDGSPPEIFTTHSGSPESRPMGLTGATLLSLSRTGELAVMLDARPTYATFSTGTLGRVSLEGGSPREVVSNVENADWSPDGTTLAVVRQVEGRERLETPPGKLIYDNGGAIGHPRFSPQGDRIAFFEHPGHGSDNGSVAVVDLTGKRTILSTGWSDLTGLAWSPKGDEIWFSGDRDNSAGAIFAVAPGGGERRILSLPADTVLFDIARDGRILMGSEAWRGGIYALTPGHSQERDLSLFDFSIAGDLSADGKTLLLYEFGEAGGPLSASFLRKTDGTGAVRLGDGFCGALSHDAKRVICTTAEGQLNEVPTGTGEVKPLTHDNLIHGAAVHWFPDEKRILFSAQEPGHGVRYYVQDLATGQPRAVTPEGASLSFSLSPDASKLAVAMGNDYRTFIYPIDSGDPRPVPGLEPGEVPVAWTPDSRFLYCIQLGDMRGQIFQVDVASGRRLPWKKLNPPDPVGLTFIGQMFISANGDSYVYSINRRLDVLYLVEGLQ